MLAVRTTAQPSFFTQLCCAGLRGGTSRAPEAEGLSERIPFPLLCLATLNCLQTSIQHRSPIFQCVLMLFPWASMVLFCLSFSTQLMLSIHCLAFPFLANAPVPANPPFSPRRFHFHFHLTYTHMTYMTLYNRGTTNERKRDAVFLRLCVSSCIHK